MANKLELLPKIDDAEAEILDNDRFVKFIFSEEDNAVQVSFTSELEKIHRSRTLCSLYLL